MLNTGERAEIASRTNANEAETVQRSKKLLSKTKQLIATADAKNLARNAYRGGPAGTSPDSGKTAQDHTHVAALKPFADSYEGGHHTAKRPELASRKDVRRAVRGMRALNKKGAKFITAVLTAVLFAPAVASPFALGQTAQTNATTPAKQPVQTIVLPGTGAPLLVTPEVHLGTVVPPVGARNATAGNTAGATTATAALPVTPTDITAVPQYAGAGNTVTFTPALGGTWPAPSTPEVHLGTAVSSVGASSATAGNTAGATNATATLPVTPRVVTALPQYTVAGSTVTITPAPEETREAVSSTVNKGSEVVPGGAQEVVLGNGFARGVGQGSALVAGGNTGGMSLGEIARDYRQHAATVNAHDYTNEDIEQLSQQPGLQVGGMSGAAVGAGTAAGTQQPSDGRDEPAQLEPREGT